MQTPPGTAADQVAIYHHIEDPKLPLTPKQQKILDDYVNPIRKDAAAIRNCLAGEGPNVPDFDTST